MQLLAIGIPGPLELGLILLIALVVFGASRVPSIGSALGNGIRMFKSGITGEDEKPGTDAGANEQKS